MYGGKLGHMYNIYLLYNVCFSARNALRMDEMSIVHWNPLVVHTD